MRARQDIRLLLVAALGLVACRLIACHVLPVYDDAFITFRYARNLAAGLGFVYQAGEHVLGTTTPLFGLLAAIPYALQLPMPGTIRILNIACDVVTLVVTWRALGEGPGRAARPLFVALFTASPILNRICVGGMEMNLYLMLSVLAIRLHRPGRGAAVALAAVGYFLRPESLLLVGLLLLHTWRVAGVKRAIGSAAVAIAVIGLPLLALHSFYGIPVSQSVLAKLAMVRPPLSQVLQRLLAYEPSVLVLLPLTAFGLWRAFRAPGFPAWIAAWMLLQVTAYAVARPTIWSWYVEPIAYASVLLAALGGAHLLERSAVTRRVLASGLAVGSAAVLAVAVWVAIGIRQGPSPVTRNVFVPLEAWCRAHARPDDTIMAYDVGAIGYYSGSRILDLAGLVWPPGLTMTGVEVMARYAPDFLYVNATQEGARFSSTPTFVAQYRPVQRFSKAGIRDVTLRAADLPVDWVQDYVLFERRDRR